MKKKNLLITILLALLLSVSLTLMISCDEDPEPEEDPDPSEVPYATLTLIRNMGFEGALLVPEGSTYYTTNTNAAPGETPTYINIVWENCNMNMFNTYKQEWNSERKLDGSNNNTFFLKDVGEALEEASVCCYFYATAQNFPLLDNTQVQAPANSIVFEIDS